MTRSPRPTGSRGSSLRSAREIRRRDDRWAHPAALGGAVAGLVAAAAARRAVDHRDTRAKANTAHAALPPGLEPYGANMVVHVPSLLALGGFGRHSGRDGKALLSDEEVQLAWRLQAAGHSVATTRASSCEHQIQAARLTPGVAVVAACTGRAFPPC